MEHIVECGHNQQEINKRRRNPQPRNWRDRPSETSPSSANYLPSTLPAVEQQETRRERCSSVENWRIRKDDTATSNTKQTAARYNLQIDPNVKFYYDEDIEGVRLVTDVGQIYKIRKLLGKNIKGPEGLFAAMWFVGLSNERFKNVLKKPYYVAPKPCGLRYMLYVGAKGEVLLENHSQHVFQLLMKDEHKTEFLSRDGSSITDTVLDGILTRAKSNTTEDDGEIDNPNKQKLTFVIMDAARYNGQDLTKMSVVDRMACIKENIISPRQKAFENDSLLAESEAFDLDYVDYLKFSESECYLRREFEQSFKYELRGLLFVPQNQNYERGTCWNVYMWKGDDGVRTSVFRLKITKNGNGEDKGELHLRKGKDHEVYFTDIEVTDEIREMGGKIIKCLYVDGRWVFKKFKNDRKHPNGFTTVQDKLKTMKMPITRNAMIDSLQAIF